MKAPKSIAIAIAVLAAIGVLAGVAIGAVSVGGTSVQPIAATKNVAPALAAGFGVFRRAVPTESGISTKQVETVVATDGVAPQLAQRIGGTKSKAAVWLAPSTSGMCLLSLAPGDSGPAAACGPIDGRWRGQDVTTIHYAADDIDVIGVVRDGVKQVIVNFRDGSSMALPVQDNVYSVNVSKPPESVEFTGPNGAATIPAGP
ncbi:MAG: hypothetical protein HY827_04440 [Actinobacteria bacterium]|nr:hypothetical protein [Actinomycetota bacterium]